MVAATCRCNAACRCLSWRFRSWVEEDRARGPPRAGPSRPAPLQRSHVRGLGDVGLGATPPEVAGEQRRDRRDLVGGVEHGFRRRTALGVQARKPRRDVEHRVAETGEVPVDEQRSPVAEAEVVAANVEVQEPVAGEPRGGRRRRQRRADGARASPAEQSPSARNGSGSAATWATRRGRTGCCERREGPAAVRSRRPRAGTAAPRRRARPTTEVATRRARDPRAPSTGRSPSSRQPRKAGRYGRGPARA